MVINKKIHIKWSNGKIFCYIKKADNDKSQYIYTSKKCLSPMFCRIFHCLHVFSPQIPCACNITNKKGLFSYFETYKIEVLIIIT